MTGTLLGGVGAVAEGGLGGLPRTVGDMLEACARALAEAGVEADREVCAFHVPGRVEVLGKHTDYAGGRSLLAAVERGFCIVAAPRADNEINMIDTGRGERTRFTLSPELEAASTGWTNYPMTVARRVARNFPGTSRGADIAFASSLPAASGMSSSSAFMIGVFLVLAEANDLDAHPLYRRHFATREELGEYLATIENGSSFRDLAGDRGVGTQGGSEDHTAILCGRPGALVQYGFGPVRLERAIPLPEGLTFGFASSGVRSEKTGAARDRYNRASRLLRAVTELWNAESGSSDSSVGAAIRRGVTAEELRAALTRRAAGSDDGDLLVRRFEHFVAESEEIIPAAGEALQRGDLERFGALVDRSQELTEKLLGNQVEETVHLAGAARRLGAAAASAFGAGFGGSVWALVETRDGPGFLERWRADYLSRYPDRTEGADFFLSSPGSPARRIV